MCYSTFVCLTKVSETVLGQFKFVKQTKMKFVVYVHFYIAYIECMLVTV